MFTQSFHCLLNLDLCLWMRSALSSIVNDDVRDGGLVVLSTFTSSSALEWVLHSDRLLFTTACLIRATYTTIKVIKSGKWHISQLQLYISRSLTSSFTIFEKADLIQRHRSRFSRQWKCFSTLCTYMTIFPWIIKL
jgi:hypothetical protein